MNNWLIVMFLSVLPISECRGSIPYGLSVGLNPIAVFFISIIFNIIAIAVLFLILKISRIREFVFRFFNIEKKVKEWKKKFEKYEELGLAFFVGIPLPITGGYTGTLIAYFLELDLKKSLFYISIGIVIAAVIVSLASEGVLSLVNFIR